ncbi:hypothetical protein MMC19_004339 [Ptychographa xylographoides]|nr:hypothetical protein [Ptychographa xylographoides]
MAAVAGGAVGGAAILALVVGLLVFFCRRRFAKSRSRTSFNKPPPVPMKLLGDNSLGLLVPGKGLKDSPYTDSPSPVSPVPTYQAFGKPTPSRDKSASPPAIVHPIHSFNARVGPIVPPQRFELSSENTPPLGCAPRAFPTGVDSKRNRDFRISGLPSSPSETRSRNGSFGRTLSPASSAGVSHGGASSGGGSTMVRAELEGIGQPGRNHKTVGTVGTFQQQAQQRLDYWAQRKTDEPQS